MTGIMRKLVATSTLALVVGLATPAVAQQAPRGQQMPCHDATLITEELASAKYLEVPAARGLMSNGNLLQIYASDEKGGWTAISISPSGEGCIVVAGTNWENLSNNDSNYDDQNPTK
jgi:hypothetical protein